MYQHALVGWKSFSSHCRFFENHDTEIDRLVEHYPSLHYSRRFEMSHLDPAQISVIVAAAINLISAYLKPVTEGAMKKIGEESGKSLYERIKSKFQHNHEATEALALVEQKPEETSALEALKPHLEAAMREDKEFA